MPPEQTHKSGVQDPRCNMAHNRQPDSVNQNNYEQHLRSEWCEPCRESHRHVHTGDHHATFTTPYSKLQLSRTHSANVRRLHRLGSVYRENSCHYRLSDEQGTLAITSPTSFQTVFGHKFSCLKKILFTLRTEKLADKYSFFYCCC